MAKYGQMRVFQMEYFGQLGQVGPKCPFPCCVTMEIIDFTSCDLTNLLASTMKEVKCRKAII